MQTNQILHKTLQWSYYEFINFKKLQSMKHSRYNKVLFEGVGS